MMLKNLFKIRTAVVFTIFFGGSALIPSLFMDGRVGFYGFLSNVMLPGATGALSLEVTRVELYFENRRPEISTERNSPNLKAYALIRLKGSGLLQGYWKVDNQILSQVSQQVTSGQPIILATPEVPPLPTFNPGTHIVRFEIINPASTIPLPKALYFVTSTEYRGPALKIAQQDPANNSINPYKPLTFVWKPLNNATVYLIEFYNREKGASPIFSAYTRKPSYTLNDTRLSKIGELGKTYYWKVKGFDNRNILISESGLWRFSFEK